MEAKHRRRVERAVLTLFVAALAAILVIVLRADGDTAVEPTPATGAKDLRDQVAADVATHEEAYRRGDTVAVFNMMSERCRIERTLPGVSESVAAGPRWPGDAVEVVVVSVDGAIADVRYRVVTEETGDIVSAHESWVLEDGRWRRDTCHDPPFGPEP